MLFSFYVAFIHIVRTLFSLIEYVIELFAQIALTLLRNKIYIIVSISVPNVRCLISRLFNSYLICIARTKFTKTTKYQALNSSRLKSLNLTITFKSIIKINISFVARFYFVCARLSCSVEFLNHCNSMDILAIHITYSSTEHRYI